MREANGNTPIVMAYSIDPVAQGLVASLARPGGNITGLSSALADIMPKQVELLTKVVPNLSHVIFLSNPSNSSRAAALKSVEIAATR